MATSPTTNPTQGQQGQQSQQIKQGVNDLTSSLIAGLQLMGVQNTQAMQAFGKLAAVIIAEAATGVVSGIGLVAAAATFVTSILSILNPTGSLDPDTAILQSIQQTLTNMSQAEAGGNLGQRVSGIQDDLSAAYTLLNNLQELVKGLPLNSTDIATQLSPVLTALGHLAPPDLSNRGCPQAGLPDNQTWMPAYGYQVYCPRLGGLKPSPSGDGFQRVRAR